jgi:hypothetical protein
MYPGVHAKKGKHVDFKHTRRAREDCHECVLSCSTNNMVGTVPHSITNYMVGTVSHSITNYMANTVSHSMTNNMANTVTPTVSTWCHEEKRREGPRSGAGGISPPYKRRPSLRRRGTNQKSKHQASRAHPEHTLRSVVVVVVLP